MINISIFKDAEWSKGSFEFSLIIFLSACASFISVCLSSSVAFPSVPSRFQSHKVRLSCYSLAGFLCLPIPLNIPFLHPSCGPRLCMLALSNTHCDNRRIKSDCSYKLFSQNLKLFLPSFKKAINVCPVRDGRLQMQSNNINIVNWTIYGRFIKTSSSILFWQNWA